MRTVAIFTVAFTIAACSRGEAPAASAAADAGTAKKRHEAIADYASYDAKLDGHQQLKDAEARAKTEGKRVLVMFGGNWCKWCRALDKLLHENAELNALLEKSYVLVHIDSDSNQALNQELGDPFKNGFPVLMVFDADGKALLTQETGALELADKSVGHDPAKVKAFLEANAPHA